jgi:two-component system chemotaxis response regulator CheB
MGKIRVVIADDSSVARALLRDFLEAEDDIEVVGEASNGRQAVELARQLKPDLITMDLEMPLFSGLQAIEEIMFSKAVPILVVSSVADAHNALAAVGCGALDVLGKPDYTPKAAADFVAKVRLLAGVSVITRLRPRKAPPFANRSASLGSGGETVTASTPAAIVLPTALPAASGSSRYTRIFAIACSTGGPQALAQILPALPANFPCPVVIAQHISDGFASGMVAWLSGLCKLPVRLAAEGDLLQAGVIHISPSERHFSVTPMRRAALIERRLLDVYHPSCDVLLSSVANVFGRQAIGITLTGMGRDGAQGIARICEMGGMTLAQNEATSVIYGMNRVAIEAGSVHQVLPVEAIAAAMIQLADPFSVLSKAGAA